MQKLSYKSLFIIVAFLIIPIIFLSKINQKSKIVLADWWNDSWSYRQAINIGNTSGGALINYQVSINIGTSTLIAAGKMKSDCSDIRITDQSGKLLPYWFSSCNTASTQIWPKVPTIPTSGATVYVYYSNSSATAGKTTVGTSDYPGLSCKSILNAGNSSGNATYWIDPTNGDTSDKFQAYCDMTNDSGGWMLVTQSMINSEVGTSVTTTKTTGTNNGLIVSNITTATGCGPVTSYKFLLTDIIPWTQIKSDYEFTGGNSCWGIFGNTAYVNGQNLTQFVLGTDTIRNQVKMGGSNGDAYDGINYRCDNVTYNFWHSNQGYGVRSAQVILRRSNMSSLAGLGEGISCIGGSSYGWKYQNIYIRETNMSFPVTTTPAAEEVGGGPVGWWKMDEGVGTSVFDSGPNHVNSFFYTPPVTRANEEQCISGKCLYFDGTSSWNVLQLPDNNAFDLNLSAVSVSAWVKITEAKNHQIVYKRNVGALPSWYSYILSINSLNKPVFSVMNSTTTPAQVISNQAIELNKWYLLTGVYNGTNVQLYIDGKASTSSPPALTGSLVDTNYNLFVGGLDTNQVTKGFIDDVKIYPYARTVSQILQDYNSGISGQSTAKGSSVNIGSNSAKGLSDGLVAYYKFDENIGTTSADSSGNNNSTTFGTGSSSPSWSSGKYGNGLNFDGVNDYATINDNDIFSPSSLSISLWFKDIDDTNTYHGLLSKYTTATGDWFLRIRNDVLNFSQQGNDYLSTTTLVNDNQWHHVVAVYDAQTKTRKIYLDGKFNIGDTSANIIPNTSNNISVGNDFTVGSGRATNGSLDEIRIYNRALSGSEITTLYSFAPGPIAYYNFDEGIGTNLLDKSGYNKNSTAFNGSPTWASGKFGKSLSFNNTTDNITIPLLNPKSITISAWFKRNVLDVSNADAIFGGWNWDPTASLRNGFDLRFYNNNTGINWVVETTNGTTVVEKQITSNGITLNSWHHVSANYDADTGIAKLYIDGLLQSITTADPGYTIVPLTSYSDMRIGYSRINNGFFNGNIDDIKIYNYARTQEQIIQDMQGDSVTSPRNSRPIAYFKLDEGNGTIINNFGIGGTIKGTFGTGGSTPTWSNLGKTNKSLSFDGVDDYATFLNVNLPNNPAATISTWINSNNITLGQTIISQNGPFAIQLSGSKAYGKIYTGAWTTVVGNQTLLSNTWYHLCLVYDGANMSLYINGKLDAQTAKTGTLAGSTTMYLGYPQAVGFQSPFSGLIDEVKVYNYALSADEVKTDYNQNSSFTFGSSTQTVGGTSTSTEYCIPGDTTSCSPPIADWKFEEGVGTSTFDTSGNNNHALLGPGTSAPSWTIGKFGKSISFDGNDYSRIPTKTISSGQFSISAWFKQPSFSSTTTIWSQGSSGTGTYIGVRTTNSSLLQIYVDGTNPVLSTTILSTNQWHHVEVTYNPSVNPKTTIYLNGKLENTQNISADYTGDTSSIGAAPSLGTFFVGSIDQVKIYNYARTPAQVAYDFNKGSPIGWWKMDDCQGTQVADWSGNANHLTLSIGASGTQNSVGTCSVGTSAAWTAGATGKINSSLNLDGIDDFARKSSSIYDLRNRYTLATWVKSSSICTSSFLIEFEYSRPSMRIGSCKLGVQLRDAADTTWVSYFGNTTLTNNTWYHLATTYDTTTGTIAFYVNGKLDGTATQASIGGAAPTALTFGGRATVFFPGQMDDVRIYNYALNSTQIQSLYNGGAVNFK